MAVWPEATTAGVTVLPTSTRSVTASTVKVSDPRLLLVSGSVSLLLKVSVVKVSTVPGGLP